MVFQHKCKDTVSVNGSRFLNNQQTNKQCFINERTSKKIVVLRRFQPLKIIGAITRCGQLTIIPRTHKDQLPDRNITKSPPTGGTKRDAAVPIEIVCPLNFDLISRSRSQALFWHYWTSAVQGYHHTKTQPSKLGVFYFKVLQIIIQRIIELNGGHKQLLRSQLMMQSTGHGHSLNFEHLIHWVPMNTMTWCMTLKSWRGFVLIRNV